MILKELLKTEAIPDTSTEQLTETKRRNAQTLEFISILAKTHPWITKMIGFHALGDGSTALLRLEDGNAIEIQVRPAKFGNYHQDKRKHKQYAARRDKKQQAMRDDPNSFYSQMYGKPGEREEKFK